MAQTTIKEWYTEHFPDDSMGEKIDDKATFQGLMETLETNQDVYGYIGVGDSFIRECVFQKLTEVTHVHYDNIYSMWLSDTAE